MKNFNFTERKNLKSTIFFLVIIVILLFVFIYTIGFKFLLNSSVFFAGVFSKNTPAPLTKNADVYGTVSIDNIPTATNSAQIFVSGSVLNYNKVDFYINDKLVKNITLVSSDNFNESIGDLTKGDNSVYVKASTSDGKNSKSTNVYTVTFKDTKPKLDISSPSDKSTVSTQDLTIKGSTDKEIFVKVNDMPVVVDATGNFETTIKLKDGDNTITIEASDDAGNVQSKTLTVTYHKED